MKNNTIKAVRATITLGDVELDCYQLPSGEYRLSKGQTCDVVNLSRKRLSELQESNSLKALIGKGSSLSELQCKCSTTDGNAKVDLVPIAFSVAIWMASGTAEGIALVIASAAESIERRADAAFKVARTEQERNERFIIRRDGIVSRNFWTDCIDAYMATHDVSDNYKRWIYIQVSDMVNKAILGVPAKTFRESLGLPDNVSTRDHLNSDQLRHIRGIEEAAAMRCKRDDLCPKQAIKDVISLVC